MQNRFLVHWLHASSCLSRRSGVRLAQFATNLAVFLVVLSILLLAAAARCHHTLISPAFHRREAARTVTPHFLTLGLEATDAPGSNRFEYVLHCPELIGLSQRTRKNSSYRVTGCDAVVRGSRKAPLFCRAVYYLMTNYVHGTGKGNRQQFLTQAQSCSKELFAGSFL